MTGRVIQLAPGPSGPARHGGSKPVSLILALCAVIAWLTALWSRRVRNATTDAPRQCSGVMRSRMRMTHDWQALVPC